MRGFERVQLSTKCFLILAPDGTYQIVRAAAEPRRYQGDDDARGAATTTTTATATAATAREEKGEVDDAFGAPAPAAAAFAPRRYLRATAEAAAENGEFCAYNNDVNVLLCFIILLIVLMRWHK